MARMFRFSADGTLEVAIFAPGVHNGQTWTWQDCNEWVQSYDPKLHEAPSVIGHADQRRSGDPAYGWAESVFWQDGMVWARLRQVPAAFAEAVKNGTWKKRSVEIWMDFMGTGKKYLRAIAWLGAQPPAVAGLPDAVFTADPTSGSVQTLTLEWRELPDDINPDDLKRFAEGAEPGKGLLRSLGQWLVSRFADEEAAEAAGPVEKIMNQEEALEKLNQIRWIAAEETYRIVDDPDLTPEEKRAKLAALFVDLKQLIEEHGTNLINAFAERSPEMGAESKITMTPADLEAKISGAVSAALERYQEQQSNVIAAEVKRGLAGITQQTLKNAAVAFAEQLKAKGMAPACVDDAGVADFVAGLDFETVCSFGAGAKQKTQAQWFQEFVASLLDAARANKLVVPFGEVAGHVPAGGGDADLKTLALADFTANKELYVALGVTSAEDLEAQAKAGRIVLEPAG